MTSRWPASAPKPVPSWADRVASSQLIDLAKQIDQLDLEEKRLKSRLEAITTERKQLEAKKTTRPKSTGVLEADRFVPQYEYVDSTDQILISGTEKRLLESRRVCTGRYTRPMETIRQEEVLNLKDFFFPRDRTQYNLFTEAYGHHQLSIMERVENFMSKPVHRNSALSARFFMAAINPMKSRDQVRDLPNVNAAVASWLMRHLPHDVQFVDPLTLGKPVVNVINLSQIAREVRKDLELKVNRHDTLNPEDKALTLVAYQRGQGEASVQERADVFRKIGDVPHREWLNIKLTPGKYNYAGAQYGRPKICYTEFPLSVAQIATSFLHIPELIDMNACLSLRKIHVVLDEFNGYALVTVAVLYGYDLASLTEMMVYHKGNYSAFRLA